MDKGLSSHNMENCKLPPLGLLKLKAKQLFQSISLMLSSFSHSVTIILITCRFSAFYMIDNLRVHGTLDQINTLFDQVFHALPGPLAEAPA